MRMPKKLLILIAGTMFLNACAGPAVTVTPGALPATKPSNSPLKPYQTAAPAAFETSNLTTSTAECSSGADMWVNVTVKNTGGQTGTYPVVLKINGHAARTENVTLAAGAIKAVHFVLVQKSDMPEFTTYKLTVDNLEKDVDVI